MLVNPTHISIVHSSLLDPIEMQSAQDFILALEDTSFWVMGLWMERKAHVWWSTGYF